MPNNETIYNTWELALLLILVINTFLLIKTKKQMRRIDLIFSQIKSLIS